MSKLLVALCALSVLGCRPPSLVSRARQLRAKLTAIVPAPQVQVDANAAAMLVAAQQQQRQRQQQQQQQPSSAERPSRSRVRSAAPEPIVHRTVAPPPTYVLRGETLGGSRICSKFSSMDECNADCTRRIREGAQLALTKNAGLTRNCVCVEGARC